MRELWLRLEAWLREHRPEILKDLNSPAKMAEIAELEQVLGSKLPDDVVESLMIHNGQQGNRQSLFPSGILLSAADIAGEWSIWKELLDAGDFSGCESEPASSAIDTCWWHPLWIPVTHDGCGNYECVDLAPVSGGRVGQVITMWHDMPTRELLAGGFREWFQEQVTALERGDAS